MKSITNNKLIMAAVVATLTSAAAPAIAAEASSSAPIAHQASNSCCHTAKTKHASAPAKQTTPKTSTNNSDK